MKTRMFAVVFAFFCSLIVVNRAGAQGCVPTKSYSNYSSQSFDDSNFNFYQTVTTEGYSSMDLEYCPPARNATHTPYVRNTLTAPNGTVYGGTSSGSSGCVNCYLWAQSTVVIVGVPGYRYTLDVEGWVHCSVAGIFWQVTSSGLARFVQAYYYRDDSSRTYHRCNPQGDACDTVYLVNSPLPDRSWPQYGLFNAVYTDIGVVALCIVGTHGVRADTCIKPDPHP